MKCGCYIDPGEHPIIIYCSLHSAAEEMRDALDRLRAWAEVLGPEPEQGDWTAINIAKKALAAARGEK